MRHHGPVTSSAKQDPASSDTDATAGKRRGRRPGGEDTRTALLAAAREVFTEQGYESATVRTIATRAGVDAAMVNHWFGGKEKLFVESVLRLPFDPLELMESVLDGPSEELGQRIVRTFLTRWDTSGGGMFAALARSITTRPDAARVLREFLFKHVFYRITHHHLGADQPELRATLCASQLIGMGMIRYVVEFEPLASTDIETLVAAVAPNVQRYLTGSLSS
ncbi:MAG: TetR family transcriptional regulator [Pseudonocardiaceae bacterium]|nr:TetR family transcriptional regulator [Pseudonocardiaceae bacterium]